MVAFRLSTGYTAPAGDAVTIALGGPGPQVYRTDWLGRPWRPAHFRHATGYTAPAGDACDLALRELVGDYAAPVVAKPTPDPVDFGAATGYTAPDTSVDFALVAAGGGGGDDRPDTGTRIGLNVAFGSRWAETSRRYNQRRGIGYGPYRHPDRRTRVPSTPASPRSRQSRQPWTDTDPRDRRTRPVWGTTIPATEATGRVPWVDLEARDRRGRIPWGALTPADDRPDRLDWLHPPTIDRLRGTGYDHVDVKGPLRNEHLRPTETFALTREPIEDLRWPLADGYSAPDPSAIDFGLSATGYKPPIPTPPKPSEYEYTGLREVAFALQAGYTEPAGDAVGFAISGAFYWPPTDDSPWQGEFIPVPNVRIQPRDWHGGGRWTRRIPRADAEDRIPWGPRGSRDSTGIDITYPQEPPEPPPEPPPLPPEKRVYLLMPSIECKRVSDDLPIVVNAASVRTDRDSWCWECDLTLARREDRDAIKPTSSGPREIELTINGRSWRFLIERHRRQRSHNSSSYSATGRSRSAELTAPYSTPRTFTTTQDRTANQAADDELENTGWSIVWNTTDWLIPAGGFSYQGLTPLQAIKRLAEAVGAVVVTDRTQKTLRVEPRYDVSPWERDEGVADKALTEDVIFQLDGEWKPGPGYNAVYVAGRQGGVIVHVVRANTAQDTEAEMTVDDLIVERLAGRERGRQILAGAGDRERVPIQTPLLPDPEAPGLVLPGTLLEVNEAGETWRGQVESCEVSATRQNATTVRQQIEVDRYYG